MQDIIPPVDPQLIKAELNSKRFLRKTNKAGNELYVITAKNSPNVMREVGRLREITFRAAGGGTGLDCDIDHYDTAEKGFKQLILWDPEDEQIIAGYRYLNCWELDFERGEEKFLATAHLLKFSPTFINEYLPNTIELGRSFVQPNYQADKSKKGIFSLDNLWDGLAVLFEASPKAKYFFGKVTMYPSYNSEARDHLLAFMHHYFPQRGQLITPYQPLVSQTDTTAFVEQLKSQPYKEGLKLLTNFIREKGERIPPLISSYMSISETMMTFGTALNDEFGGVEETGILVTIDDIFPEKKNRHLEGYVKNPELDWA
ncbi:MAG: GNAT family N-acetyltransferase [Flavobacteriales bacterium]|nr:MAG: GNAT family N-acetyltransferase [Flavobacteriales bacterium]